MLKDIHKGSLQDRPVKIRQGGVGPAGPAVQADIGKIGGELPLEPLVMAGIFRAKAIKGPVEGLVVAREAQVAQLMIDDGKDNLCLLYTSRFARVTAT